MAMVLAAVGVLTCGAKDFLVTDYGASADGKKCTEAFARAVAACAEAGGGRVVVPSGTYYTGKIHLKSNMELHLEQGAVLDFSDDPTDYEPAVLSTFEGCECLSRSPLIYCYGCTNIAVTGPGLIRPRLAFWATWGHSRSSLPACKAASDKLLEWSDTNVPVERRDMLALPESRMRPPTLQFNRCKNIRVENLNIKGSPFWTIHLYRSEDAVVRGCNLDSHTGDDHREHRTLHQAGFYLGNSDGVDIEMTKNVLVERCTFCQCDDVIVVKAGRGPDGYLRGVPSENVTVLDCDMRMGHSVFSVGSEISAGARNLRVKGVRVSGEITGGILNVKTNRQRGGFVENVVVEDVTCHRVRWPLHVDAHYAISAQSPYTKDVAPTKIRGLRLENVRIDWARTAALIKGDKDDPPEDVTLKDIVIKRHEPLYKSPEFKGESIVTSNVKDFKADGVRILETGKMSYETGYW